jgi:hypothetical protein
MLALISPRVYALALALLCPTLAAAQATPGAIAVGTVYTRTNLTLADVDEGTSVMGIIAQLGVGARTYTALIFGYADTSNSCAVVLQTIDRIVLATVAPGFYQPASPAQPEAGR